MSGRVQKESADDSDRVDDAVDPRVQVRVVACASPRDPRRGCSRYWHFAVLRKRSRRLIVCEQTRTITLCFATRLSDDIIGNFMCSGKHLLFCPLHLLTCTSTRVINVPDSYFPFPALPNVPITTTARAKLPLLPGNFISTQEIGTQYTSLNLYVNINNKKRWILYMLKNIV